MERLSQELIFRIASFLERSEDQSDIPLQLFWGGWLQHAFWNFRNFVFEKHVKTQHFEVKTTIIEQFL